MASRFFTVRDAAARLPNGEGTRAEICELLKDSQFLAPDVTSAQVGLSCVLHLGDLSFVVPIILLFFVQLKSFSPV